MGTYSSDIFNTLSGANASYSTAHGLAEGEHPELEWVGQHYPASVYGIYRSFVGFDTGEIGAREISSAYISMTAGTPDSPLEVVIVYCDFATSGAEPVLSDYALLREATQDCGRNTLTASGTFTINLNSFGISKINKHGMTKFGIRAYHDIIAEYVEANKVQISSLSLGVDDAVAEEMGGQSEIVLLEAIRNIEMSAAGRVYVDEQGQIRYETRYTRML